MESIHTTPDNVLGRLWLPISLSHHPSGLASKVGYSTRLQYIALISGVGIWRSPRALSASVHPPEKNTHILNMDVFCSQSPPYDRGGEYIFANSQYKPTHGCKPVKRKQQQRKARAVHLRSYSIYACGGVHT